MKLQKRILKDYNEGLKRANALHALYLARVVRVLRFARSDALNTIRGMLASLPELTYSAARQHHFDKQLERDLDRIFDSSAHQVARIWAEARDIMAIHGRLMAGFVARKSSPPWIPTKIDLQSGVGETKVGNSWTSAPAFHLKNLSQTLQREVMFGLLREQSIPEIMRRVQRLLGNDKIYKGKESDDDDNVRQFRTKSPDGDSTFVQATQVFGGEAADQTYGYFTPEDVEMYRAQQIKAMDFVGRSSDPFNSEVSSSNASYRALDSAMMQDLLELLHNEVVQVGTDNMGIKDFVWIASKPQKECDECTDRDQLTMTEIEDKIDDEWGSQAPPLHPNCRCQLIPKLRDDWAKDALHKDGYEWGPDEGLKYVPNQQEQNLGFEAMDYDQWVNQLAKQAAQKVG